MAMSSRCRNFVPPFTIAQLTRPILKEGYVGANPEVPQEVVDDLNHVILTVDDLLDHGALRERTIRWLGRMPPPVRHFNV